MANWRECRILHISMRGMGLYLRHPRPADIVGRSIQVQIPADADSLSARLKGTVRNAVVCEAGFAQVTVEFSGLSRSEQALATVLDALTQTGLNDDRASEPVH